MFDVGWIEMAFIAVLALLIVGPKDLPKLLKMVGAAITRARKLYRRTLASVNSLEREVQLSEGKGKQEAEIWRNYVPEAVRNLPADFLPGSMSAEEHQARRRAFEEASQNYRSATQPATASSSQIASESVNSEPPASGRPSEKANQTT